MIEISEEQVRHLVEQVMSRIITEAGASGILDGATGVSEKAIQVSSTNPLTGLEVNKKIIPGSEEKSVEGQRVASFTEMDRLIDEAEQAQRDLATMTLEKRKEIINNIRAVMLENLEILSRMAVEETGMGNVRDKQLKNRLAIMKTPGVEDIEPVAYTDDYGLTLIEHAPYGVIGSITPSTNATETLINNGIGMIAAGNAVVFNPHPAAKKVSNYTISLFHRAILKADGPPGIVSSVSDPTIESAQAMMRHPKVCLLVVTGGPGVVKAAMASGKKVIAAGPGNPPVVVDETADIEKAARDIVSGAGLDNNIVCICEKEILAVSSIADILKEAMKKYGAYELNKSQIQKVTEMVIADPGRPGHEGAPNKKFVGKDAAVIASAIGIKVSPDVKILLCEVEREHPLVWTEQLMPVIPIVRMGSADEAIDYAVQCEHGFRHTASIHSKNIDRLSRMAKVMNCSVFVKNGPNYAGLGYEGPGFTSFTIASPTGEGMTRARTFTRERRCSLIGYFRII
ncbi:MAG: aldehyde dehydrogenase family protein [Spirochaetota bacterium]